ncbi:MFS transporter [Rhizobium laguerreae]|uniref:MFS transporter n=1 Tax=Rhizobium laguerreae TaxID=1076926 RepID=UPI001C91A6CB|nr:MFS transporter [Rhizobium laguerreae]MBY3119498.1 MFS transporter [Rhizobium laguerreae]MBY3131670.1 MFS transporter [Rhizobium laguerreae]MBY3346719.1 MFS transporter [Rhizobium laguerreae]MBY3353681.1 MFS transporter [Rhizobium laguerreae]MBY3374726.1 MFS transporter [Rhizobium laguerreae]
MKIGRMPPLAVLVICQALWTSAGAIILSLSGIVGDQLSTSKMLSTLPFALMLVSSSISSVPASWLMYRKGRRAGFIVGALFGCLSGVVSAFALYYESFTLFCVGLVLWGVTWACAQFLRYAASETVSSEMAGRAVSTVLAGSIVGVFTGSSIAVTARDLISTKPYVGSYLAISCVCAVSLVVLLALQMAKPNPSPRNEAKAGPGIALRPPITAAFVNGVVGSLVMVFLMTAAPLAMVHMGHSATDAVGAIRWHLIGMYVPSFFTGILVDRYGDVRIMLVGIALLLASAIVSLSGTSMHHFSISLLVLGVGWNFMIVTSTILLSAPKDSAERAKVQGASEVMTHAGVATVALLAGGLFAATGWDIVNLAPLPLLLLSVAATLRFALSKRRSSAIPT